MAKHLNTPDIIPGDIVIVTSGYSQYTARIIHIDSKSGDYTGVKQEPRSDGRAEFVDAQTRVVFRAEHISDVARYAWRG